MMENNGNPIEVWLRRDNLLVACMVVHQDESTERFSIGSPSLRAAQREVTRLFTGRGYRPAGRWVAEGDHETLRRFKAGHR